MDAARIVLPDAPAELADALAAGEPIAWEQELEILTYEAGEPSEHPMYLDRRVYQGSSGAVYPIPFIESVAEQGTPRRWRAVHLENEHVRLVILPELGGRIHIGYDKTTGYDFLYRNNVIKPALVGLAGPWISGGIELNWPQHHRPGTYLPVETRIEHGEDGSTTIWCHDHDPFDRMSAHHGVRLRPGSSVVELVVGLHNRTSERHTFLWWANVAAAVGEQYQSFFPEDVRHVADHARRSLVAFPAADRPYYGVDYPALARQQPGADRIDWYRSIQVPTSYMIVDSQESFFGGYDHGAGGGFVHWAERRISPGKKQWTWGNAPFGRAWDAQLTDADGPYVELMAGVYTDNQPDFSWLLPGETKTFTQHWYPIPAIGPAHQATVDAAVNVERDEEARRVTASAAVTSVREGVELRILRDGRVLAARREDLRPGQVARIAADGADAADEAGGAEEPGGAGLRVELRDASGEVLVAWEPTAGAQEEPWVAEEPPAPEEIGTVEELYLTGRHLMQNRHPTRSPLPYWREALRRDPGDARTNTALAERHLAAGRDDEALEHARTAIARMTCRNGNPTDTEAMYLAGLALQRLGRREEAEEQFGKAGWDATWAAPAGVELARSLARRGQDRAAVRVLESLRHAVGADARRSALEVILARRTGRADQAQRILAEALAQSPLDVVLRVLDEQDPPADAGLLVDAALDLARAGEVDHALQLLGQAAAAPATAAGNLRPTALYIAASLLDEEGREQEASRRRADARASDLTRAFPAGNDALAALQAAVEADENDAVARFLLGMGLYARGRRREAQQLWDRAIDLGLEHPVLRRNAALAAYALEQDDAAWAHYVAARALAPHDARLLYEQDQLAATLGHEDGRRLARLAADEQLVLQRDDLTIEYIGLLVRCGQAPRAQEILTSRSFHPWEGGEGRALAAWDATRQALGLPRADPPASLGEARPAWQAPVAVREDGVTDYFATSLPDLLLFVRDEEG